MSPVLTAAPDTNAIYAASLKLHNVTPYYAIIFLDINSLIVSFRTTSSGVEWTENNSTRGRALLPETGITRVIPACSN